MAAENIIAFGSLEGRSDHTVTGTVTILKTAEGGYKVHLGEDFELDGAPDPKLRFGKDDDSAKICDLQQHKGAQVHDVPSSIDPLAHEELYVWCAKFDVPLAVATLRPPKRTIVSVGNFSGRSDHTVTGTVTVMKSELGYTVHLCDNFELDGAPDPQIGFFKAGFEATTKISDLRRHKGSQVYAVPPSIDPTKYDEFYVWCTKFDVPLGVATLGMPGVVSVGTFEGRNDHTVTGTVTVLKSDAGYVIHLSEDFQLDGAPDPKLHFGKDGKKDEAKISNLGKHKGWQVHAVPGTVDPNEEFFVWCEKFDVPLGVASLKKPEEAVISTGVFEGRSDHTVTGTVAIKKSDIGYTVHLAEDFELDGAPDPKLHFGKGGKKDDSKISNLGKHKGSQVYLVPPSIDPTAYDEIYVWCVKFDVPLGIASLKGPEIVATGQLEGRNDHVVSGTVMIKKSDLGYTVHLGEDFDLDGAPDPKLRFGTAGKPESTIGSLVKHKGWQVHDVPPSVDPTKHEDFYVWCKKFDVPLGVASLKTAEFADKPSEAPLADVAAAFRSGVEVKDRWHKFCLFKKSFVGSDAVDFLISSDFAQSREDAVALGQSLESECKLFHNIALIEKVRKKFEDGKLFYRFN